MEAVKVDLNTLELSGKGVTGNCYDCKDMPGTVVKLYDTIYPKEAIYAELESARKVYDLGIPSPEPGELVTDGVRLGLRFKKICNKRSYSQSVSEEPERCEEFAREFARVNKKLHSMVLPAGTFPYSKQIFKGIVEKNRFLTASQKLQISEFVDSLPDMDNALHGDLHMGNVISTLPKGAPLSEPHEIYFIDLGYFSQGYPLIDLSINDVICNYVDPKIRIEHYHLDKPKTQEFWKYFVDEYFFGEDNMAEKYFGKGATKSQVEKELSKLTALRLCQVTYILDVMEPEYLEVIQGAFGK